MAEQCEMIHLSKDTFNGICEELKKILKETTLTMDNHIRLQRIIKIMGDKLNNEIQEEEVKKRLRKLGYI